MARQPGNFAATHQIADVCVVISRHFPLADILHEGSRRSRRMPANNSGAGMDEGALELHPRVRMDDSGDVCALTASRSAASTSAPDDTSEISGLLCEAIASGCICNPVHTMSALAASKAVLKEELLRGNRTLDFKGSILFVLRRQFEVVHQAGKEERLRVEPQTGARPMSDPNR